MLSKLEKKLLYILDEDSSQSLTEIGQEVDISPQLVSYHLEQLERKKVILAYWPMIDFRKIGYFNTSYFLKLKNVNKDREKEIIDFLTKRNNINILMRGDGYWDLHLTISALSLFKTVEIFNIFFDKYHENILQYDSAISMGFYQFRREYLNQQPQKISQQKDPMSFTGGDVELLKLSDKQLKVIEIYNKKSRDSFANLSKLAKMSRDKFIYHLKKLKKEKVIQNNSLILDIEKIGYSRYRILLELTDFTSDKFKLFYEFCQSNPNIIHLLRLFGNWQALIDIEIEDQEKLRLLLQEIKNEYSDLVLRVESTRVYKIDKFRDVPFKLK